MIRNPSTDTDGKPLLCDDETIIYSCDLCGIEFGDLESNGSFYITSQRIIWLSTSSNNNNDSYSFCCSLIQLMVHALCKDSDAPYVFLQLENQTDEVKIINKSYDKLQEIYESLCEGQRLNPCEGDSDGGDAFVGDDENENENENDVADTTKNDINENDNDNKMKEWEDKLQLDDKYLNMVNNSGYLEPAADGQFEDVEDNKQNEDSNNVSKSQSNQTTPSFDPFAFANSVFDSKPISPKETEKNGNNNNSAVTSKDTANPYLDADLMEAFTSFTPKTNKTFESKFKSYKQLNTDDKTSNE